MPCSIIDIIILCSLPRESKLQWSSSLHCAVFMCWKESWIHLLYVLSAHLYRYRSLPLFFHLLFPQVWFSSITLLDMTCFMKLPVCVCVCVFHYFSFQLCLMQCFFVPCISCVFSQAKWECGAIMNISRRICSPQIFLQRNIMTKLQAEKMRYDTKSKRKATQLRNEETGRPRRRWYGVTMVISCLFMKARLSHLLNCL